MVNKPLSELVGEPENLSILAETVLPALGAMVAFSRLRLMDQLDEEPVSIEAFAEKTSTRKDELSRVLRFLAGHGLIDLTDDDLVRHNAFSRTLRGDHPRSIRGMLASSIGHKCIIHLTETLTTGESAFSACHDKEIFDYLAENPAEASAFAEYMTETTARVEQAIFRAHTFEPFTMAVDIGGNHGSLLQGLLEQSPGARGVVFDLPEVAAAAEEHIKASPLRDRIEVQGGDFFEGVPEGGDLYLLKQVLHDWSDEESVRILKNVRAFMSDSGRVAIVERLIPEEINADINWAYDVWMMAIGGRERKLSEFTALLERAGFTFDRVTRTDSALSVIEAFPTP